MPTDPRFARSVLTVASGTLVAQAIPVLASPFLTRLYAPAEFGVLALYLSLVAVGAVAATGRYELAILIPPGEADARALTHLAITVATAFALACSALAALVITDVLPIPAWDPLGPLLLLVPLGILATAAYQSIGYWLNRHEAYRRLSASRVVQSATMLAVQLGGGLLRAAGALLVVGHLLGQVAGIAVQAARRHSSAVPPLADADRPAIARVAREHVRFPKFLVPGHVANALSSQLPVLLLAGLYGPATAGLYALAERVLVLPSALIGSSIGDVYRQRAAAEYAAHGNCRSLFLRTVRQLALLSILPCLVILLFGPALFALAFGAEWRSAGGFAAILSVMVFLQMVSSPLSQTVYLAGMQRLDLAWQLCRLALSAAALALGATLSDDPRVAVMLYAAAFGFMHAVHSIMQYHAASGRGEAKVAA